MAATAPAHYIRSIHTSFTAAHPRDSSSWANAASNAAAPRYAPHLPSTQKDKDMLAFQQQPQQYTTQYQTGQHHHHLQVQYNHPPSISTHNSHTYTHHLYAASSAAVGGGAPFPAAAATASAQGGMAQERGYAQGGLRKGPAVVGGAPTSGRRRSASIRMPPSYTHQRGRSSPAYKFDPFADDEAPSSAPLSVTTPLTSSSQANRGAPTPELEVVSQKQQHQQQQYQHTAPYTIHIPAAQPTEIQQYTPPPSPRPAARTTVLRSLTPINGPLPGTAPTMTTASKAGVQGRQAAQPTPNLSKIVAGILLNRVHAVGKPMRRRVMPHLEGEKGYRKSCLSSVVSVEA
ncbi:hypothetical protein BDN70DRAFT_937736 [Pholiota conissans]|uniref:Uncharacterized protein n=1 Tax=Pholiota conissans TaxID=109636 RepID=A0A9P5YQ31_9AGAR|nr:hypothetical protein BDN70DRAFT_937736 [Pholiota conissans]